MGGECCRAHEHIEELEHEVSVFPDNIQFWYETKRVFGASSYGASEFGEVMWSWEVDAQLF